MKIAYLSRVDPLTGEGIVVGSHCDGDMATMLVDLWCFCESSISASKKALGGQQNDKPHLSGPLCSACLRPENPSSVIQGVAGAAPYDYLIVHGYLSSLESLRSTWHSSSLKQVYEHLTVSNYASVEPHATKMENVSVSSFADGVANAVIAQFRQLPAKRKPLARESGPQEWVPLSGIVAEGNTFQAFGLASI